MRDQVTILNLYCWKICISTFPGHQAIAIYQPETGACSLHTTSLFSENIPSCKLSRAIHLKGSLTLPPDLSCLKYPDLYMSSASPKSATLITQSPSILSAWEMLVTKQLPYKLDCNLWKNTSTKVYIHAVSCCQVSVHKILWCQIVHPLSYLPAQVEEELLYRSNLGWEWVWVIVLV